MKQHRIKQRKLYNCTARYSWVCRHAVCLTSSVCRMHTWAWLLEATGAAARLILGALTPLITKDSGVCVLQGEPTGWLHATSAMFTSCSPPELSPMLSMAWTQHNTTTDTSRTELDVLKHWLSCTRLHKERVRPLEMQQRLLHWHLCIKHCCAS